MKNIRLVFVVIMPCLISTMLASCQWNPASIDRAKNKSVVSDPNIPQPTGFVNDFEDIFSGSEEKILDSVIRSYNKIADVQIALATFDTNMVKKDSFQSYTFKVAQQWGVGERGKNNGVFICVSNGNRIMYIHNGIGSSEMLSDAATKSIIDTAFVPEFKKNNIYAGVLRGLHALMVAIADKKDYGN